MVISNLIDSRERHYLNIKVSWYLKSISNEIRVVSFPIAAPKWLPPLSDIIFELHLFIFK